MRRPREFAFGAPLPVRVLVPLSLVLAAPAAAQSGLASPDPIAAAVSAWTVVDAPPGHEAEAAAYLAARLPGWTTDRAGNLVKRVGNGAPRRVVACALDQSSFVVSQITEQGYLRLRRTGVPAHPLWNQFHEAQRIKVFTASGPVPGVVAVANGHFSMQHRGDTAVVTMDDLWVDIGASSSEEVARRGVSLLDAVAIDRPAWTYEGFAAGPGAGARAGCAAVATVASGRLRPGAGETVFVISSGRALGWTGLSALLSTLGPIRSLTIVDDGQAGSEGAYASGDRLAQRHSAPLRTVRADSVRVLMPRVRFARSMVESVRSADAKALLDAVAGAAGVTLSGNDWVAPPLDSARALSRRGGVLGEIERQWMALADLPGVAGHEHRVRRALLEALPDWARRLAVVDSIGNVIVAMGPDRDSVAFIAHMDEVGFEVTGILADGRVALRTRGGAVVSSWEGVPALLHFDPDALGRAGESLRGVFVPRDSARVKAPPGLTAWFGLDSAQLAARGVRPGLSLTAYKRADRLAGTRLTGRGSDDRTGTTALLLALGRLAPDSLDHKVIFVWSVQEEGGLNGARFFGERHGASLRRVYSVDTFVSSDTPKESPHFAYAPLGAGPVLRGVDNSSLAPRLERERIIQVARGRGIPLQVGTTFGGTDGSAIQPWGPPNVGLSWPGRYSHGPAEVLDLRDVEALIRLVAAVAVAK